MQSINVIEDITSAKKLYDVLHLPLSKLNRAEYEDWVNTQFLDQRLKEYHDIFVWYLLLASGKSQLKVDGCDYFDRFFKNLQLSTQIWALFFFIEKFSEPRLMHKRKSIISQLNQDESLLDERELFNTLNHRILSKSAIQLDTSNTTSYYISKDCSDWHNYLDVD